MCLAFVVAQIGAGVFLGIFFPSPWCVQRMHRAPLKGNGYLILKA